MKSLWLSTSSPPQHATLGGDLSAEVIVLGGGIAGLTTAYLLQRRGLKVALLEARQIARGVTGNTTAKVTSNHTLTYRRLSQRHGLEIARKYGQANQAAVDLIRKLVKEHNIECNLTDASAFTISRDEQHADEIAKEIEVAGKIGLPARSAHVNELPFKVHAAMEFTGQFHFHPVKYLAGLCELFLAAGGRVFEHSPAVVVEHGATVTVQTAQGTARATNVVVATHQPCSLDGWYFARMRQKRSFAIALRLEGSVPRGMYISVGGEFVTMRPTIENGSELLIFGGESHQPGQEPYTVQRLAQLEQRARKLFPVAEVRYRWATHDNVTGDGLPFIGQMRRQNRNVFVATGFAGWGMSNGTASGMILADLVTGEANPHAEAFDPLRGQMQSRVSGLVRDMVVGSRALLGAFRSTDKPKSVEQLAPGGGAIFSDGLDRIAVHRDDEGALYSVGAVCTHLQCIVRWNNAERTWDCPCHGSRFDVDGGVLHGPAVEPLACVEPPAE